MSEQTLGALTDGESQVEAKEQPQSETVDESIAPENDAVVEQNEQIKDGDPEGFVKRISKMTARQKQTEQLLMQEQQRSMLMQQQLQQFLAQQSVSKPAQDPYAPKPPNKAEFAGQPLDYADALASYYANIQQYQQYKFQKEQQENEKQKFDRELTSNYVSKLKDAKIKHPDWDDVFENLEVAASNYNQAQIDDFQIKIKALNNGPEVAYYLGNNLNEFTQIMSLDPRISAVKLAEIGASLKTPAKKIASSPPPPKQLIGSNTGKAANFDNESIDAIAKRIARRLR